MILQVGTFPPPLHGMSAVNQAVFERLAAAGIKVEEVNTAPATLKRDMVSRLSRWTGGVKAWSRLLKSQSEQDQLYIALSGGWGQVYDLVSLSIARSKNLRCILHHHSFAYLQNRRTLTAILMQVAGKEAIHIVLCSEMARVLRSQYGDRKTLVLSNAAYSSSGIPERLDPKLRAVGFLSNITKEKGAETVIELAFAIKKKGMALHVIVAGPCFDGALTQKLNRAVSAGVLEWRGGVYGEEKKAFWQDIDVLVFPTQYINEAEPLVIVEALANGIPVISYERGCIREQMGDAGVLISPYEDFVPRTLQVMEDWSVSPAEYQRCVRHTQERYRNLKRQSIQQWQALMDILSAEHRVVA